jgi:stearoyl-CoA desaturase (delta-9 desaturase)
MPTRTAEKRVWFLPIAFLIAYHVALAITLPWYLSTHVPSTSLLFFAGGLMCATMLAVTVGTHRLYAHGSFQLEKKWIQYPLVWLNTLAAQGSIIEWASDHRHHHKSVDTDEDPYAVKDGFWHAHIFWLFKKRRGTDLHITKDLYANPLLKAQYHHYDLFFALTTVITTALIGYLTNDYFGAIVFSFLARIFIAHNLTFFINSAAHYWGEKTFSKEHSAVNNWFISLFTFGEGYHNYHHTFPQDYRNGVRWWQYDPSKWTIWMMAKLGLVKNLQMMSNQEIQERVQAEREGRHVVTHKY